MANTIAGNFNGVDSIDDWVLHFRLEKMADLLKDFGVTCVADLADLYSSADLIAEVEKRLSQIEMKRFRKAAKLTTQLAGIPFPSLGGMTTITDSTEVALLEEEEALKLELEKSRMKSMSALGDTAVRIDNLKKEVEELKRREREEAIKTAKRKATELALTSKIAATHARKISILALESLLLDAATVDLCILMDCTGSMLSYMNALLSEIENLVRKIKDLYPNIGLRMAFVAYRDHCDGAERLKILSFEETKSDIKKFQRFVGSQVACGGGDAPEDVMGGITAAADLNWQSATRILYHVGDAPCHGNDYHDKSLGDSYPMGHPSDVSPSIFLNELANKQVSYFFGKLNSSTDMMISKFNGIMGRTFIETEMLSSPTAMMTAITKSATTSMKSSIASSVRSGVSRGAHRITCILDPVEPNWNTLPIQVMNKFSIKKLSSLQELLDQEDDSFSVHPVPLALQFKVGSLPFAQGGLRAAYKAKEIDEISGIEILVVHKLSLSTRSKDLTRKAYEKDLAAHRAASFLAENFNTIANPLGIKNIRYVVASVGQNLTSKGYPYFIQEQVLIGTFEKFNSNRGFVEPCPSDKANTDHSAVQAFSHWTYHVTSGQMMVIDCQGVYNDSSSTFMLTDPAVHCTSLLRFEPTNMGAKGMENFFTTHRCNDVCRALRIPAHK